MPNLRALARHALPSVLEGVLLPVGIFYLFLWRIGAAIDATGWPLPEFTLEMAKSTDAILLGAANPVLAEYLFVRRSERRYLFLTRRPGPQLDRVSFDELGTEIAAHVGIAKMA